jgi:hypothetical protein
VFQSTPEFLLPQIKPWIIGVTAPTVFPFVASIMLLTFFGFAPDRCPNDVTGKAVHKWPAKMGILLMVFGFLWIMGDLIGILYLLGYPEPTFIFIFIFT